MSQSNVQVASYIFFVCGFLCTHSTCAFHFSDGRLVADDGTSHVSCSSFVAAHVQTLRFRCRSSHARAQQTSRPQGLP
ncbi:uncharacterized protein HD556DRAFT_1323743 [Suillus plorans]|uniref:Uncharacterized protein n=1 Tax=Suillus plorans TaxID=116603 RepID=A0A9P7DZD5_9AGAM|nr:uncharacterized protein HD556DRAFT_1323743 [Suillus plorans]KAG1806734.1 hypothetical protein HD556DRAFT_1323743 [Suillus plorans]